ncbi:cofilin family protein [Streptomyces sp. NPDC057684]|uniref:cofilin family protein n=1 Tax=Streptomyces sp. NPDC057684 TaxID=3346211 RepID=UPI0036C540E6
MIGRVLVTSAISVEDRCIDAFNELKRSRHITTVLYRLNDSLDTLTLDFEGSLTHEELLKALPSDPRFVAYELSFADRDGTRRGAIALISWCPKGTSPEQEAAHAAGYAALRNQLDGIDLFVEATSQSDLEYHQLLLTART